MPTASLPTARSLKRDKGVLLRLHAAVRLSQELLDRLTLDPKDESSAEHKRLYHIMEYRLKEIMGWIQSRGATEVQAEQLARAVLQEMMATSTQAERRDLMPLTRAIGTRDGE
jgi:hypothetical protein